MKNSSDVPAVADSVNPQALFDHLPAGAGRETPIAVIGWGRSGRAAADALRRRGLRVRAFDQKQPIDADFGGVDLEVCDSAADLADRVRHCEPGLIVVSPGVPQHAPVFALAHELSIPLWGEVELAWRLQQSSSFADRPWLAVTGTNGKTTTVGLLGSMLRAGGARAVEVGNIGTPIVEAIDSDADVFAVELSSFQLFTAESLSPLASVCLNVDADHVDWHGSVQAYAAAKARVYENTQIACVYPAGDPDVEHMVEEADVVEGARAIGITLGSPTPSQFGLVEDVLVDRAFVANRYKEAAFLADFDDLRQVFGQSVTPAIVCDVLAAAALARAYGVSPEDVRKGLLSYRPENHRRTFITHAADMDWINDSKATNGHAAVASLKGIPVGTAVWIAGGDMKGQNFDDIIPSVVDRLRGVVAIGRDRSPLLESMARLAPQIPVVEVDEHEDWMFSVVNEAVALSRPGDTVILAPAAASWDQFDSYTQRGEVFTDAVMRLAEQWALQSAAGEAQSAGDS